MSDRMTRVEIEDVLSSIRRLVSEDLRAAARTEPRLTLADSHGEGGGFAAPSSDAGAASPAGAEPPPLVLSPSLRVVEGGASLHASLEETIAELEAAIAGTGAGQDWQPETVDSGPADLEFEPEVAEAEPDHAVTGAGEDADSGDAGSDAADPADDWSTDRLLSVVASAPEADDLPVQSWDADAEALDWSAPGAPEDEPGAEGAAAGRLTGRDSNAAESVAAPRLRIAARADLDRVSDHAEPDDHPEAAPEAAGAPQDAARLDDTAQATGADERETDGQESDGQDGDWQETDWQEADWRDGDAPTVFDGQIVATADALAPVPELAEPVTRVAPAHARFGGPSADSPGGADLRQDDDPDGDPDDTPEGAAEGRAAGEDVDWSEIPYLSRILDAQRGAPAGADAASRGTPVEAVAVEPGEGAASRDAGPDDAIFDEAALRGFVSEIIREELQGALGERITRNLRKLVHREVQRALAARDFD
ncbi:hypothetical protein [Frigidibacter oleivorans]|uniref:hypothetical protein n=1 Tax=Frigidibacter oleivorans TaxID=2487129 RepID=UPI000F8EB183|nr:hypothetical protein [Frigidibacter oleivorans]